MGCGSEEGKNDGVRVNRRHMCSACDRKTEGAMGASSLEGRADQWGSGRLVGEPSGCLCHPAARRHLQLAVAVHSLCSRLSTAHALQTALTALLCFALVLRHRHRITAHRRTPTTYLTPSSPPPLARWR